MLEDSFKCEFMLFKSRFGMFDDNLEPEKRFECFVAENSCLFIEWLTDDLFGGSSALKMFLKPLL